MSDPMSNREIEDVLSSIRRLVTQDDAAPTARPAAEKLVLTPAFRVAEPPAPVDTADAPEASAPAATSSLEQTIAELEAAISAYAGPFEPDGGEPALPGEGTAIQITDEITEGPAPLRTPDPAIQRGEAPGIHASGAPNVSAFSRPDSAAPKSEDDEHALLDGDETEIVFDEAMLRELVTDILREELQGALGQRITRNVRKLVRAEIARALASRDLA